MTRTTRYIIFGALLFAIGAALFQGTRVLRQQRADLGELTARAASLEDQLARLGREHAAAEHDLAEARRQLGELPSAPDPATAAARAREGEMTAWLGRVRKLKQLFEQRPGQRIPEMRLLKPDDWLSVAKQYSLDDEKEIRRALALVRSAAISEFTNQIGPAIRARATALGNNARPANAQEVAPYLANPANGDLLADFTVATMSNGGRGAPGWELQQSAAIDSEYDNRASVSQNSSGSMSAPFAWIPDFRDRITQAAKAYATAHPDQPAPRSTADVMPYVNPPFDAATLDLIQRAEKERGRDW